MTTCVCYTFFALPPQGYTEKDGSTGHVPRYKEKIPATQHESFTQDRRNYAQHGGKVQFKFISSRPETVTQCCFNIEPVSQTIAHH